MSTKTIGSTKQSWIMGWEMEQLKGGKTVEDITPQIKKLWRMNTEQVISWVKEQRKEKRMQDYPENEVQWEEIKGAEVIGFVGNGCLGYDTLQLKLPDGRRVHVNTTKKLGTTMVVTVDKPLNARMW